MEVLFQHPLAKVVRLTTPARSISTGSSTLRRDSMATTKILPGTLAWSGGIESLQAVGPMCFYRTTTTNIVFLTCGRTSSPFMLTIFPKKTQCWCVDGETKFVILFGENNYYRLDLLDEGKEAVSEELKRVLPQILLYEKTLCPFRRDFMVDIPGQDGEGLEPETPKRKRPWRRPEPPTPETIEILPGNRGSRASRASVATVMRDMSPVRVLTSSPAMSIQSEIEEPEVQIKETENTSIVDSSDEYASAQEQEDDRSSVVSSEAGYLSPGSASGFTPRAPRILYNGIEDTPTRPPRRGNAPGSLRLKLDVSALGHDRSLGSPTKHLSALDSDSLNSSASSFFSFHSPISPVAPQSVLNFHSSPPSPSSSTSSHHDILLPKTRHRRDTSDMTITSAGDIVKTTPATYSTGATSTSDADSHPSSPIRLDTSKATSNSNRNSTLLEGGEWAGLMTPPDETRSRFLQRRLSSQRSRSLSPMPPSTILVSGPPSFSHYYTPGNRDAKRGGRCVSSASALYSKARLGSLFVQKTYSLMMGPSSYLISVMLNIAARIASGALKGTAFASLSPEMMSTSTSDWGLWSSDEEDQPFGRGRKGANLRGDRNKDDDGWSFGEVDDYAFKLDARGMRRRKSKRTAPEPSREQDSEAEVPSESDFGGSWDVD
jgi:hypothetical protein